MTGGILVIDKPSGWTSHDVVAKLRGILRERRIGHGGTLDPMATGVLVVFVGKATRAVQYLPGEKTYLARFCTGFSTDTLDITGEITQRFERVPEEAEIVEILPRFTGDIDQVPPMVSAIKVDGQPLYKLARKGVEVERKARRVRIDGIEWLGRDGEDWRMRVSCSAGTYIRTLVDDIGSVLGSGACLTYLRREKSGPFSIADAINIGEASLERLLPVETLFSSLDAYTAETPEEESLRHGNPIAVKGYREGELVRVYSAVGDFLLLGLVKSGMLWVEKGFFEVKT